MVLNGHGIVLGDQLFKSIYYIKRFLEENPNELIFVTFQEEGQNALTLFAKRFLIEAIFSILGDLLITKKDTDSWFQVGSVTMGDLRKTKKRIFLTFNENISNVVYKPFLSKPNSKELSLKEYGIMNKSDFYMDRWFNTDNKDHLLSENIEFLKRKGGIRHKFLISQFILTIQPKFCNIFSRLVFIDLPSVGNFSRKLNKHDSQCKTVIQTFPEKNPLRFNIGNQTIWNYLFIHAPNFIFIKILFMLIMLWLLCTKWIEYTYNHTMYCILHVRITLNRIKIY